MVQAFVFVLCLVEVSIAAENQKTNVNVAVVESIAEYLSENPDAKLLQPLKKEVAPKSVSPYILITYRLGNRISGKF